MYKAIAISTGPETHLDHLGVLASLLGIPLIVTERRTYQLAKRYYPSLEVCLKDPIDLSIDYLAAQDYIFQCGLFWATELLPLISTLYPRSPRVVFCPHGHSDKGHAVEKLPDQDIALFYGSQMDALFRSRGGRVQKRVLTGNYRFPFYRKERAFYDACATSEVFSHLSSSRRIILYAPSWNDGENLSSFFTNVERVVRELAGSVDLLIKPHPLLEEHYPGETTYLIGQFEKSPHLHFLQEFPPIYPLLARVSAYLGDFSSIGYDFLPFDRPLYFLNPKSESLPLQQCGMTIPPDAELSAFLESSWHENQHAYSRARRHTYRRVFADERSPSEIKREILSRGEGAPAGG